VTGGRGTGGGGDADDAGGERTPQSVQSVPLAQALNSAPAPPSSHSASLACWHVSVHIPGGGEGGNGAFGGAGGGGGGEGDPGVEGVKQSASTSEALVMETATRAELDCTLQALT